MLTVPEPPVSVLEIAEPRPNNEDVSWLRFWFRFQADGFAAIFCGSEPPVYGGFLQFQLGFKVFQLFFAVLSLFRFKIF